MSAESFKKLSVLVAAYNEEKTIADVLNRILSVDLAGGIIYEVIVVNDASTDSTEIKVQQFIEQNPSASVRYFKQPFNQGKGAALHKAIAESTGDYIVVQDADMEYDPQEFNLLLQPVFRANADVVYGSRFMGGNPHRILFYWHSIGNRFLTSLSNMFTNLNLTDMETCYKLIRTDIAKSLLLTEKRFGFEPEITAKLARIKDIRIYEVGISYYGRTYSEGKKIKWQDGMRAMWCILKYNIWSRKHLR